MIYEATITIQDGRKVIASVEADDKDDAKYEFAHFPYVEIDGKHFNVTKVDYRTVRLAVDQTDSAFRDELERNSVNY